MSDPSPDQPEVTPLTHGPLWTQSTLAAGWVIVQCDCGWESEPVTQGLFPLQVYADHITSALTERLHIVEREKEEYRVLLADLYDAVGEPDHEGTLDMIRDLWNDAERLRTATQQRDRYAAVVEAAKLYVEADEQGDPWPAPAVTLRTALAALEENDE